MRNYNKLERDIARILRKPPNEKPAHIDRIQWDQADIIARAIVDKIEEEQF